MNLVDNPPFPDIFGPIGKNYCLWFYILAFVSFFIFILSIIVFLYIGITGKQGIKFYLYGSVLAFTYFVMYLQSRLLFNMCRKSLV